MLSLPLPWVIVTANVSLGDNEGAWVPGRGGGWDIKDVRCRKIRCELSEVWLARGKGEF